MEAGEEWDLDAAVEFIVEHKRRNVALQFPRDLISSSHTILHTIKSGLHQREWHAKVFLLADLSQQGATIDVIAAGHLQADAVVQFGNASREPISSMPIHHVLRRQTCDVHSVMTQMQKLLSTTGKHVVIILDSPYAHVQKSLLQATADRAVTVCSSPFEVLQKVLDISDHSGSLLGTRTDTEPGNHFLWVGSLEENATLQYALITCGSTGWSFLNPATATTCDELPPEIQRKLRRRRFLVNQAQEATIVGILVGTVAIDGWQKILAQIKAVAKAAGKKAYTVYLGKPVPEKLANFPEVNVWVHISDPAGFVWDSKPYLSPVVTPVEAVEAWLPLVAHNVDDSGVHASPREGTGSSGDGADAVMVHPLQESSGAVTVQRRSGALIAAPNNAAEFFLHREFHGVETPATGAPVKAPTLAKAGLSGRAATYADEGRR